MAVFAPTPSTLAVTCLAAAVIGLAAGRPLIAMLRRLKAGQSIRSEGPQSHQVKTGTPTMGGLILLLPMLVLTPLLSGFSAAGWLITLTIAAFGLLGGLDDWLIIRYKNNKGLPPRLKLFGQLLLGAGWGLAVGALGENAPLSVPFTAWTLDLGWWYVPFSALVFASATNAVNLTDGLDGLAGGTGILALLALMAVVATGPVTGLTGPALIAAATLVGGLLAFLWFNWHPAQVFMGDLGSLALGAGVTVLAASGRADLWLPIAGFVFVAETLSVISQVASFKLTGKRIWRMSPLHHHFELGGWPETKVVGRFYIVAALCALVTVAGVRLPLSWQPAKERLPVEAPAPPPTTDR